jgi:hypothetical protein
MVEPYFAFIDFVPEFSVIEQSVTKVTEHP